MRAVMPQVPPEILDWRRRTGADRWDEMWQGELHMPPTPSIRHQDLAAALLTWLEIHWKGRQRGNKVRPPVNLASSGGWPNDYRIPDLVLVTSDSQGVDRDAYYEGPPMVVIEIRSPGDESYEKLDFYAGLGVPEVRIIDRDAKSPEIYVLDAGCYAKRPAGEEGWISGAATGVRLRAADGELEVEMIDDPQTRRRLPED